MDDESPVLASLLMPDSWTLLTTKRLIWSLEGITNSLFVTYISEAKIDIVRMTSKRITKNQLDRIQVISSNDQSFSIAVEKGWPCNGFLSVLMHIARLHHDHTDD